MQKKAKLKTTNNQENEWGFFQVFHSDIYWVTQKLLQMYTANHATFLIRIRKIKIQICGNFWVTQYKYIYTKAISALSYVQEVVTHLL